MRDPNYIPKPTRHLRGQAVVRLEGRDCYLGKYGTAEAKAKYEELISQWLANGRRLPQARHSVGEVVLAYLEHSKVYYESSPKEIERIILAFRPLTRLFKHTPADEFGPLKLKAVREKMLETQERVTQRKSVVDGKERVIEKKTNYFLSRRTINQRLGVIKRAFKWAVENELTNASVFQSLATVPGLKHGRSSAKETSPIKPVCREHIEAVLSHVNRHVAALIRLQLLTGARSGELVIMREIDIDKDGSAEGQPLWIYRPQTHKNAFRSKKREIYLGPRAQELITPFLAANCDSYLFSPMKARQERFEALRANRKTRVQPSQRSRKKTQPQKMPGERYTSYSLRRAIAKACRKAGIDSWHPHQIRHTTATEIRKEYGVEMARIILGHSTAFTTEIYAEVDQSKAMKVASKLG